MSQPQGGHTAPGCHSKTTCNDRTLKTFLVYVIVSFHHPSSDKDVTEMHFVKISFQNTRLDFKLVLFVQAQARCAKEISPPHKSWVHVEAGYHIAIVLLCNKGLYPTIWLWNKGRYPSTHSLTLPQKCTGWHLQISASRPNNWHNAIIFSVQVAKMACTYSWWYHTCYSEQLQPRKHPRTLRRRRTNKTDLGNWFQGWEDSIGG